MVISTKPNILRAIYAIAKKIMVFIIFAIILNFILGNYHITFFQLPFVIISVFVSALSIFLGFRLNAAFNRWFQTATTAVQFAVNSRLITTAIQAFFSEELKPTQKGTIKSILYKQIAYTNLVRLQVMMQMKLPMKKKSGQEK